MFVYLASKSFASSVSSCRLGGIKVALNVSYFDQLIESNLIFTCHFRTLSAKLFIPLLSPIHQDQLWYSEYVACTLPSSCVGVSRLKLTLAYAFLSRSQLYSTLISELLVPFQFLFTFDFFYYTCKTTLTSAQDL